MDATPAGRYRASRALFERLVELPDAERDRALAEVEDPALRDAVARLLVADGVAVDLDVVARLASPPPERIGPYRVIGELGRGAMGVVYDAEEAAPRRRVAIKMLHPWLRTPALAELARREAQAMAEVVHPGIPSIHALLEVDGSPVVVMERVEGERIDTYAATLPVPEKLMLLARVCDAVACAHRRGIVHRDLKPANVLVTAEGQPKVLDFGIAWHADGAPPPGSGTPAFMPPEQRRGEPAVPASDVYALGLLCCLVLIGRLPAFDAPSTDGRSGGGNSGGAGGSGGAAASGGAGASGAAASGAGASSGAAAPDGAGHPDATPTPTPTPTPTRTPPSDPASTNPDRAAEERFRRALFRHLGKVREDVRALLVHALAADPADRHPDAGALAADLRRSVANLPVAALQGRPIAHVRSAVRRRPLRAVALLLAAMSVVASVAGRGALREAAEGWRAASRLHELRAAPGGLASAEVRAALEALLADPAALGTPAYVEALGWKAENAEGAERLAALAAAWIHAGTDDAAARDALVGALLDAGDATAARVVGVPDGASPARDRLRDRLALDGWDLAGVTDVGAPGRWARALATAEPTGEPPQEGLLLDGGARIWTHERVLRYAAPGAAPREWALPDHAAAIAVAADGRFVVRGDPWLLTGRLDDATTTRTDLSSTPGVARFDDLDGNGTAEVVYAVTHGDAGLFTLGPDGVADLHAGTRAQALPVRAFTFADFDGDGRSELLVGATGWRGHELRAYTVGGTPAAAPTSATPIPTVATAAAPATLTVADRLRLGVWAAVALPAPRSPTAGATAVLATPTPPPPRASRLFVAGGPAPTEAAPRSSRTWLLPVAWADGRLVPGAVRDVGDDVLSLDAADVDGDGAIELVVQTVRRGVGILDPDGPDALWLPGLTLLDAGPGDADAADELWVRSEGARSAPASFLLGAGDHPLPPRTSPLAPPAPTPAGLRAARERAWERAARLAANGRSDLAAGPLFDLCAAAGFAPALVEGALQAVGVAGGDGALPSAEALRFATRLLDAGASPPGSAATDLLLRAHAFDEPGLPRLPEARVSFAQPLPPVTHVGPMGAVRRNALSGTLELDLVGGDEVAVGLPLRRQGGGAVCADLDLDLREIDWSAGLEVALRGERTVSAHLWRVGGGPRGQHRLSLSSSAPGGPSRDTPYAPGPRTVSLCVSEAPAAVSFRLDDQERQLWPLPAGLGGDTLWLELRPERSPEYDTFRRARLDVRGIRLRGATLADGPEAPAGPRALAEGDPAALRALAATGTPYERALAAEALGSVSARVLAPVPPADRRRLLRRALGTWGALVREADPAGFARAWAEAWNIPLNFEDPWAGEAALDPSLGNLPFDTDEGRRIGLARARSLLQAGRLAPAESLLAALRAGTPEAWLLTALLEARRGRPDLAHAAIDAWLARAPSPEQARDRVTDTPELAALVPELRPITTLPPP